MRSGAGWLVVSSAIAAMALWSAAGCAQKSALPPEPQGQDADGSGGGEDGGHREGGDGGGGSDAGVDGGHGGGTDGGTDGGSSTIIVPSADGWTFYGPESGAPAEVWSVSSDAAGNL